MYLKKRIYKNDVSSELLLHSFRSGQKVNLLLDDRGLMQAEGFIKTIETNCGMPFMELKGGMKIVLKTIVSVNPIFTPASSEKIGSLVQPRTKTIGKTTCIF